MEEPLLAQNADVISTPIPSQPVRADDDHPHDSARDGRPEEPVATAGSGGDGDGRAEADDRGPAPPVLSQACAGVLLYVSVGIGIYVWKRGEFKGKSTHPIVDALYFCAVSMCTVGYGDIVPATTFARLFACAFVLVGFAYVDTLLARLVSRALDNVAVACHVGAAGVGMRARTKVGLALLAVVACIGVGTVAIHALERLSWTESLYLAVTSVTTVGYGDAAFRTAEGRLFAVFWLLASTLAVERAFLYLTREIV